MATPFDIRSYSPAPGQTQVETRGPGSGFQGMTPQGMGFDFASLLRAKMEWERWKIQQQMRMQQQQLAAQQQQRGMAMAPAGQQREALQATPNQPTSVTRNATFAQDQFGLTPFTGMSRTPWQPGMPMFNPHGLVATYGGDTYGGPSRATPMPSALDIYQTWLGPAAAAAGNARQIVEQPEQDTRAAGGNQFSSFGGGYRGMR